MQLGATSVPGITGSCGASTFWTFQVTERDIRHFQQAIGEPPSAAVPPLFFQAMAWQDVGPEQLSPDGAPAEILGGPPNARSMGGASEFTVHRAARVGETISVCSSLLGVHSRQGRHGPLHLVTRQTTFTDAAGVEVARELATYLRRPA
ncbi:MAG: MaoC family dehydratase N-terminal domain-containing protein [Betaproteobacteria bacterium]|jgi:hydroxyacyl-ACP dehydratase HTD2-like protein with hotdog domain